jgi:hypothetical protein
MAAHPKSPEKYTRYIWNPQLSFTLGFWKMIHNPARIWVARHLPKTPQKGALLKPHGPSAGQAGDLPIPHRFRVFPMLMVWIYGF